MSEVSDLNLFYFSSWISSDKKLKIGSKKLQTFPLSIASFDHFDFRPNSVSIKSQGAFPAKSVAETWHTLKGPKTFNPDSRYTATSTPPYMVLV